MHLAPARHHRTAAAASAPPPGPWRVVATVVALAVAATCAGFGAGLGVRHLQKVGLTFAAVIGLLLLVAGLVLLTLAVRRLWRSGRGGRVTLIPASFVALVLAWSAAVAAMVAFVPPTELGRSTPADVGIRASEVSFRTSDGALLSAWWAPGTNGSAIVLLHGAGSTRTATLPHAAVLARRGFGVLLVDARGHGRSGGRGMDLGWFGDRDVSAAVGFVAAQPAVDPARIGVLGLSMGGEEALGAAGSDPRIRAVVAEGATGRTAADKSAWLPGGIAGFLQRGIDRVSDAETELLTPAPKPEPLIDSIGESSAVFLVISGGAVPDEARAAAGFRAAAPDRVQTWDVPGAGHTAALGTDPAAWETRVVAFLADALAVRA